MTVMANKLRMLPNVFAKTKPVEEKQNKDEKLYLKHEKRS